MMTLFYSFKQKLFLLKLIQQIEYNQKKKIMQICKHFSHPLTPRHPLTELNKAVSKLNFESKLYQSHQPQTSIEEENWKMCSSWIIQIRSRIKISTSSVYLTISYLLRLVQNGFVLREENYEKVGCALIIISTKMNEIYPPKFSNLIKNCLKPVTKEDIVQTEAEILSFFNFEISFSEITYSYIAKKLNSTEKLHDCEKLLALAVTELEIMKWGEELVALGVIYLIKPSLLEDRENQSKAKIIGRKIYHLYIGNRHKKKN